MIETPPEARLPIQTRIAEDDDGLVRDAINRELDRGGQVFFVHNRVETIESAAERVRRLVPRAKIAIGHGQMAEGMLERVMLDFDAGRFDVLVCTTIIESGLDIPNANTIIINRADTFGLAQLYQLRGRVGRSDRRAYAYLLHRRGHPLSPVARKRLHAIFSASDLGAGYQIALSDLEIRGAGNILGAEQHGFMAAVGFELYTRMLAEAVDVRRGRVVGVEPAPVRMDLPGSAYLPDAYVGDSGAKLEMYRRFAAIRSDGRRGAAARGAARPLRTDPGAGRGLVPGGGGAHGGGGGRRAGGPCRGAAGDLQVAALRPRGGVAGALGGGLPTGRGLEPGAAAGGPAPRPGGRGAAGAGRAGPRNGLTASIQRPRSG